MDVVAQWFVYCIVASTTNSLAKVCIYNYYMESVYTCMPFHYVLSTIAVSAALLSAVTLQKFFKPPIVVSVSMNNAN